MLALIFLSPLTHADIGIGAIVIDSQIEGKGSLDTNGGINVGDTITTGPKGNLTILFDDESMLTLGPNARAKIVKYSETPAPGISEIKIISGGFRYFPGIILENGGKQVLNNVGGTNVKDATTVNGPDIAVNTENELDSVNNQLEDTSSLLTEINNLTFSAANAGTGIAGTGGNTGNEGGGGAANVPPPPPPP